MFPLQFFCIIKRRKKNHFIHFCNEIKNAYTNSTIISYNIFINEVASGSFNLTRLFHDEQFIHNSHFFQKSKNAKFKNLLFYKEFLNYRV